MIWQESIQINVPVSEVYRYLADFPRHCEWAQTVERLELIHPGDSTGVGARYRTLERQAMQANRKPRAALTHGMRITTICEIRQLIPNRRIAWSAHTAPKATGLHAELSFDMVSSPTGTTLTQHYHFYQPAPAVFLFKLIYGRDLEQKGYAQWAAGLANIKAILEQQVADRPMPAAVAASSTIPV